MDKARTGFNLVLIDLSDDADQSLTAFFKYFIRYPRRAIRELGRETGYRLVLSGKTLIALGSKEPQVCYAELSELF